MTHQPVLLEEVIEGLNLRANDTVVDGTLGGAGHTRAIAEHLDESGTLIGIDADAKALVRAREKLRDVAPITHLVESNFRHLSSVLKKLSISEIDKVLLDIGLSSFQLEESGRGFTFQKDEPLLMTFNESPQEDETTCYDIVNSWEEENIADVIYGFGEEKGSRAIAKAIVEARSSCAIETTKQLAEIVADAIPKKYHVRGIHPATKTFQALRIAVNDELGALTEGLHSAYEHLSSHGRIAVISFHSLEDRVVKRFFREHVDAGHGMLVTKKPITPTPAEVLKNSRARSAKLRIFEKN